MHRLTKPGKFSFTSNPECGEAAPNEIYIQNSTKFNTIKNNVNNKF
eukprot:SAG31_NODE_32443_length_356_cov_0.525292_1_plen_46_part_00